MTSSNDVTTRAASARDGKQSLMNATSAAAIRPFVDIFETADGITLRADMPGVSKEGLNLRVEGANLLVEGTIDIVTGQKNVCALRGCPFDAVSAQFCAWQRARGCQYRCQSPGRHPDCTDPEAGRAQTPEDRGAQLTLKSS